MPLLGTIAELHGMLLDLSPAVLALTAGLAVALEASLFIGLLIPGEIMLLVAATAATTPGRFGAVLLAGVVGSVVGESLGYLIGRTAGPALRRSRPGRRLGATRWEATDERLRRYGPRAILVGRFTPVVHALVPVLLGSARVPYRRCLGRSAVAGVVWTGAYVTAGAIAGANVHRLDGSLGMVGYAILAAVLAVVVVRRWVRRRATLWDEVGPATESVELVPTVGVGR